MTIKEEKIKFLVFSAAFPYRGGISDSTHSLCNELIRSRINTEVWTFSLLYPSFLFPGKSQYSNEQYEQNFKIRRLIIIYSFKKSIFNAGIKLKFKIIFV